MIFLRFSTDEYITRLQKEGQIFCNSIQTLSEYKDDFGRGDEYENIFEQFYSENGTLSIKPVDTPDTEFKDLKFTDQKIKFIATKHYVNVFCLYTLDSTDYKIGELFELSNEIKKMGTHCLFIFNISEFITRIKNAISGLNTEYKCDFIKYVDFSKYTGKRTVFEKPIQYNFQKEFRIAIKNNCASPIELFIGSIEDFSYKCPISDLKNLSFNFPK